MLGDCLLNASRTGLPDLLSPSLSKIDDFEILRDALMRRRHFDCSFQGRLEQRFCFGPRHRRVIFGVHKYQLKMRASAWNVVSISSDLRCLICARLIHFNLYQTPAKPATPLWTRVKPDKSTSLTRNFSKAIVAMPSIPHFAAEPRLKGR
jgi:hypothetical protein